MVSSLDPPIALRAQIQNFMTDLIRADEFVVMSLTVNLLSLLCLVQVWPSSSQFVFEVELVTIDVIGDCDTDVTDPRLHRCEPVFSMFCLREGRDTQSNNMTDCPLGRNDERVVAYTPDNINDDFNTRPGLPSGPVTRRIVSQKPWPGTFQLYIEARELDPPSAFPDVHLDDIFINRALEVNTNFTGIESYNGTGTMNNVIMGVKFRVMCQQNYYGADCATFCLAQNDDVFGHYTCNSDGSIQCLEGFKNPSNNCTEALTACDFSPCANGGSCTPMPGKPINFICQCVVGYTGRTCEVNIDDCASATCPNNSMCVDGVNTFECICMPGFETIGDLCVAVLQTGSLNTDTDIAIGVGAALVAILVIIIVVLMLVVIKQRTKKPYDLHQGQQQKGNKLTSTHSPQELEEKSAPTDAVYATPSSPEATVRKLDNPVYGDDEYDDVNVQNGGAESKRKRMEVNEMETYKQLHHGIDPPDFVRLAEVEGAGYGSLH